MKKSHFGAFWFYDFLKWFAFWPWFLACRPKLIYSSDAAKEKIRGGFLMASNHNSFYDTIYIQFPFFLRRRYVVGSSAVMTGKLSSWIIAHVMTIRINKDHPSPSSIREIVRVLKDGYPVGIFAEGTVNHEFGTLLPLKEGTALFAYMAKVPIVPIYIRSERRPFERLRIGIGEAIFPPESLSPDRHELSEMTALLSERITALMPAVNQK